MIKRLLTIRYICKKYKVDYSLLSVLGVKFFRKSDGWVELDGEGVPVRIGVNPFMKNFYETLLHETGHIVLNRCGKNGRFKENYKVDGPEEHSWILRVEEEALASKFAIRVLKGEANVQYLEKCWHTYTRHVTTAYRTSPVFMTLIDTIGKNSKIFWRNKW
jgi:hypothetical protein